VSTVVAFVPDLMDRSRLSAAGEVTFVSRVSELAAAAAGATLVIVDLSRPGALDAVGAVEAPVVGFAPHVEDELLAAGLAAGCEQVLPRSVFFRRLPELLA
jgi:hypothetical protein